jgi:hypothetical protein
MTVGCPGLVKMPERDQPYPQEEIEQTWGHDEKLYEDCRVRHAALRNFYRKRDGGLRKLETAQP